MSKEKVERYKEEKKNRAQNAKKAKRIKHCKVTLLCIVICVIVGWIGWSVYTYYNPESEAVTDLSDIQVTDENGNPYSIAVGEDGEATLVVGDSSVEETESETANASTTNSAVSEENAETIEQ